MGQQKLIRFNEIKTFKNVLEKPADIKGKWKLHFKNNHPITLELACGKGEYTVGLARMYKDRNFIGVDIKGNRIWKGAKTALAENLENVAFLRTGIDKIADYFKSEEVGEIWITFPDPQLRNSKHKKRLTHPRFLRLYQSIIMEGGKIHLKTDSPDLYNFTKTVINLYNIEVLSDLDNVYAENNLPEELYIKTHYEQLDIAQSNRIHYLSFKINIDLPVSKDEELKRMVYEVVRLIPKGRVTSYGAIARYLGTGKSARMVGWAMNAAHDQKPKVPAHRVVNRNGMLSGKMHFSTPDKMQQLLEKEGITVKDDQIINFSSLNWDPSIELC